MDSTEAHALIVEFDAQKQGWSVRETEQCAVDGCTRPAKWRVNDPARTLLCWLCSGCG